MSLQFTIVDSQQGAEQRNGQQRQKRLTSRNGWWLLQDCVHPSFPSTAAVLLITVGHGERSKFGGTE